MAGKGKPGRKSNKQLAKEAGLTLDEFMAKKERKAKREAAASETETATDEPKRKPGRPKKDAAESAGGAVVPFKAKSSRKLSKGAERAANGNDRLKELLGHPIEELVDQYCIASAAASAPKSVVKDELELLKAAITEKLDTSVSTAFGSATLRKKEKVFISREKYIAFLEHGEGDVELSTTERNSIEKDKGEGYFKRIETSWEVVLEASKLVKEQMAEAMAKPVAEVVQTIKKRA